MKALSPESFSVIAVRTGLDVEAISAVAVGLQHDIARNRDAGRGSYLTRLKSAVQRGTVNRRRGVQLRFPFVRKDQETFVKQATQAARKLEARLPGSVYLTSEVIRLFVAA